MCVMRKKHFHYIICTANKYNVNNVLQFFKFFLDYRQISNVGNSMTTGVGDICGCR